MNTLSWLIYFADIAANITTFYWIVASIFGTGIFFSWIIQYVNALSTYDALKTFHKGDVDKIKKAEEELKNKLKYNNRIIKLLIYPVIIGFFVMLVPSKETIYLIAGSEMSEMVIVSEPAQEIFSDIKTIISNQAKELSGE